VDILKTSKNKLVLKPTSDPAKSPPMKKSMKKHTIRLLTDKGVQHHRKTIRRQISKMNDEKVRKLVQKAGLLKNPNTPMPIMEDVIERNGSGIHFHGVDNDSSLGATWMDDSSFHLSQLPRNFVTGRCSNIK
jgi:hypothetical protein